jgi:hypothetical protein
MRITIINALLCAFLAILGNSILPLASDNSVVKLQKPVLSLQLNSRAEIARTVSAATHLLEPDRRLQTCSNFQVFCDIVEDSGPFDCDCDATSRIAVCDSSEICNRDTCAKFDIVNTFDTAFNLISVQTCVEYTKQVADYRNGCAKLTLANNGQVFDTCEMSFVDDGGNLMDCNECRVCDGRIDVLTFDLNCSNIEVEASTSGCMVAEDDTALFPGFEGGVSTASDRPPVCLVLAGSVIATLFLGLHNL